MIALFRDRLELFCKFLVRNLANGQTELLITFRKN